MRCFSCTQTMEIASGAIVRILAVSSALFFFFFGRFSAFHSAKVWKKCEKKEMFQMFALSLLQVLLSGLIGVVSWKRPLSLVVSGLLTSQPLLASSLHAANMTRICVSH